MRAGLAEVEWPARLQRLTHGPLVAALPGAGWELWLDGGHNASAAGRTRAPGGSLARQAAGLVFGMLNSKDAERFLAPLAPQCRGRARRRHPGRGQSLSAEAAAAHARAAGHRAQPAESPLAAVEELVAELARPSRVLICGSLYLAGKISRRERLSRPGPTRRTPSPNCG